MIEAREIGRFSDYDGLHQLVRARADELQITRETLDDAAKLTAGYASKLLAPAPIKALGRQTLGPVAAALGVEFIMIERVGAAGDSLQKRKRRTAMLKPLEHGVGNMPEARALQRKALHDVLRANGRKGGPLSKAARMTKLTPSHRRRIAKKAAKARWRKPKVVEIKTVG